MNSKIEFIYFDLGNVIVNFDHSRIGQNLAKLTNLTAEEADQIVFDTGIQTRYESGQLTTSEFVAEINHRAQSNISATDLCRAVSDIFWLNRGTIPLITQLKSANIPMAILSNTCEAHWNFVLQRFPSVCGLFQSSNNILSFESYSMKPENKIYHDAVQATGLNAESIFFTDDRLENVQAAQNCGIRSVVFENAHQVAQTLADVGVKINF